MFSRPYDYYYYEWLFYLRSYFKFLTSGQYSQMLNSLEVLLLCKLTNRIQHDQELCVLHPLKLWKIYKDGPALH